MATSANLIMKFETYHTFKWKHKVDGKGGSRNGIDLGQLKRGCPISSKTMMVSSGTIFCDGAHSLGVLGAALA